MNDVLYLCCVCSIAMEKGFVNKPVRLNFNFFGNPAKPASARHDKTAAYETGSSRCSSTRIFSTGMFQSEDISRRLEMSGSVFPHCHL